MLQLKLNRWWLGGLVGLAVGLAAPIGAQATERGSRFDRSGTVFDRNEGSSTWRHSGGYGRRRPQAPAGGVSVRPRDAAPVGSGSSGDPEAPEPTAALLFGAGLLAVRAAARRERAR
jgi:hypothetical protein